VDDTVKDLAVEDVLATLRNGHPLNRIITSPEGKIEGYNAREDFIPHEAYINYLSTNKAMGCNLLSEIPTFIDYARNEGYTRLHFHGWNTPSIVFLSAMDFIAYAPTSPMGFQLITLKKS
jgi:hypothetical protein